MTKIEVIFEKSFTKAQAITENKQGALYFTTDTNEIILNGKSYADNVKDTQYNSGTNVLTITYATGATSQIDFAAMLATKVDKKPDGTNPLFDVNNKITTSYLPDTILGQLINAGNFVPSTGVATLTTAGKASLGTSSATITLTNNTTAITGYIDNEKHYYVATSNGTFAGITFAVGDWLQATASGWFKVSNTDAVSSVNSKTGAVVLTKSDIGLGNVDDVKQATKTEFDTHLTNNVNHITDMERTNWNAKLNANDVVNDLTTSDALKPLAANQGVILKTLIDNINTTLYWRV